MLTSLAWYWELVILFLIVLVVVYAIALKTSKPPRPIKPYEFIDPNQKGRKMPFPSLFDNGSIYLTLVVPCYKEEARLPKMMDETMPYLERRQRENSSFTYEVILVDDGSSDRTSEVGLEMVRKYGADRVRLCTLEANRGKGGAVRQGFLLGRGKYFLMVDADGATQIDDLANLERKMKEIERDGLGIVIGSRSHLEEADRDKAKRKPIRRLLQWGFHVFVERVGGVKGIRDTQCGFKLFSREASARTFPTLHLERWAFDVELLFLAQRQGIPMAEVAVNWQEIAGSKLDVAADTIQMARDLMRIRFLYTTGIWRIERNMRRNQTV